MKTITIDRKKLDHVLESIEYHLDQGTWSTDYDDVVTTLREALNAPKSEPVAVVDRNDDGYWADILPDRSVKVGQFLYAAPPRREWVSLTVQEIADLWVQIWSATPRSGIHEDGIVPHRFAYAIEAALKERNHE